MSIKVKEVLELAQSKGCTLAAGEGGIDRIVRFVDCMEIPDMKAWMRPNVLYITTGYAYSDTKEEIMNLIRNLYEAKAAALATKYRYIGCFLDDAIKLANELQFPIILWPEDLPFIEMNYLVMEALIKSQNNLMDTIHSRIEKYNRREMDKRLFAYSIYCGVTRMRLWRFNLHKTNAANEELVISLFYGRKVQE